MLLWRPSPFQIFCRYFGRLARSKFAPAPVLNEPLVKSSTPCYPDDIDLDQAQAQSRSLLDMLAGNLRASLKPGA